MKKLIYIMLSLCCLVFYSCGMTEPWKDWEHEGDMSADRLRPSEVKRTTVCGRRMENDLSRSNVLLSV